jgi:PRC-barrel domain
MAMLRSMNALTGFTIGATDGDIGTVAAFYFDDLSFTVRHLVVDTGGWLSRQVLISPRALGRVDWDARRLNAALTRAQVERSPDVDTDRPVSRQKEIEYHQYYGYPTYWSGPYLWGGYPLPVLSPDAAANVEGERRWDWETQEGSDPHLQSSAVVIGYHIAAADGEIGHVEDFLVDEASWAIRYLVVDTSNWWFGKHVLVSVEWIGPVDWNDSLLHVDLTREQIKSGPEYDASQPPEREYEARLHDYYGRPGYWSPREESLRSGRR